MNQNLNRESTKIIITGGGGQLAHALQQSALAANFNTKCFTRNELDITDQAALQYILTTEQAQYVVNAAAYTAVDQAESEQQAALNSNYLGCKALAQACAQHHCKLIHISTDYIFSGLDFTPSTEETIANPINFYGKTKLLGEQAIASNCDQFIILRISGVFSAVGKNFVKTMLRLAQERTEITVVDDQITCPTDAQDIADVIYHLIHIDQHHPYLNRGHTYHYCNKDPVSWFQFANTLLAMAKPYLKKDLATIKAIPSTAFKCAARRPAYSVLDCSKIARDFAIQQRHWRDGIARTLKILFAGTSHD